MRLGVDKHGAPVLRVQSKSFGVWRHWTLPLAALGVAAVLLAGWITLRISGATSAAEDSAGNSRVYPGSDIKSLTRALALYHVRLPDCAKSSVEFGRYIQVTTDSLYLRFSGDDECISEFLASNELEDEQRAKEKGLPFVPKVGAEFGWPEDPQREFLTLRGTLREPGKASLVDVLVAIDYSDAHHDLFLRAGIL
jgi:hypothetical protein